MHLIGARLPPPNVLVPAPRPSACYLGRCVPGRPVWALAGWTGLNGTDRLVQLPRPRGHSLRFARSDTAHVPRRTGGGGTGLEAVRALGYPWPTLYPDLSRGTSEIVRVLGYRRAGRPAAPRPAPGALAAVARPDRADDVLRGVGGAALRPLGSGPALAPSSAKAAP